MNSLAHPQQTSLLASASRERLGVPYLLLLVWLAFEFGRPTHPLGIPLIISVALFIVWITTNDKQWSRQSRWWIVLLCVLAIGIPLSANTYAAFWSTRDFAIRVLCICLPLQALVTSVRKVRLWLYTFVAISVYIGGWAATRGGYGPSGSDGGQDENYVAAIMGMATPFAYFSIFSERRFFVRVLLVASIVIFVAAIALGQNPSRGGFVGLCAVGLYCLSRSPRKLLGLGIVLVIGGAMAAIAGPSFWAEIATTTDYQSGTSDMRLEIWKTGLRMWEANPVLGVGAGNFRWVIEDYQSAEQFAKFGRGLGASIIAHSFWVEMVAELGTVGLITTMALTWHAWTGLGRVRDDVGAAATTASVEAKELANHADAIRGGILAILVNGIFLSLYYYSHLWLLLAIGSAVPFVYSRISGRAPPSKVGTAIGAARRRPEDRQPQRAAAWRE